MVASVVDLLCVEFLFSLFSPPSRFSLLQLYLLYVCLVYWYTSPLPSATAQVPHLPFTVLKTKEKYVTKRCCYMRVHLSHLCRFVVAIVKHVSLFYRGCDCVFCRPFFFVFAAVVAIMKLPVALSNAVVAEAALWAVYNLAAGNAENKVKLGSAGACKGG